MSIASLNPDRTPLVRVVDLNVGEKESVILGNGKDATVQLLDLQETRDEILSAVFSAEVTVKVDERIVKLNAGLFNLPKTDGNFRSTARLLVGPCRTATWTIGGWSKMHGFASGRPARHSLR